MATTSSIDTFYLMPEQRPISEKTKAQYEAILARGLIAPPALQVRAETGAWPESVKLLLRAALRRAAIAQGVDPAAAAAQVPRSYTIRKAKRWPTEEQIARYEDAAAQLPRALHVLAVLPLYLGVRADELIKIQRADVERAIGDGQLRVLRKRGKEQYLPSGNVSELLTVLLETPRALPRDIAGQRRALGKPWRIVGEVLSAASPRAQYVALYDLIRQTGAKAGVKLHPHLLRHVAGTRMWRDSGDLNVVKALLGHENIATTQIYVHADSSDLAKHMRKPR